MCTVNLWYSAFPSFSDGLTLIDGWWTLLVGYFICWHLIAVRHYSCGNRYRCKFQLSQERLPDVFWVSLWLNLAANRGSEYTSNINLRANFRCASTSVSRNRQTTNFSFAARVLILSQGTAFQEFVACQTIIRVRHELIVLWHMAAHTWPC